MASYKVKNATGPWPAGTIITDEDLKRHPEFGGVVRLRDELGSIEDTNEKPNPEAGSLVEHVGTPPPELTSGNPLGVNETPADRVQKQADADTDPNARGRRAAGKS
jgi:hypothetical protein